MPTKLLLDTDIGSDIDDAVCLAYLLAQPKCELLGVTTVSGEPERRAMLVSAICKAAGKDVPIFPGTALPLLGPQKQPHVPEASVLTRWPHDERFPHGQAIEFLRQTIHAHPGEITLLGIGPMTNIALLFTVDPAIPALLKSLVLMCGVFTDRLPGVGPLEWNALCDPHAAALVYRAAVPIHRSIGLDVTCQVTRSAAQVRAEFQADLLKPVLDFAEVWFHERPMLTFHDPLAAATIFDDTICGFTLGAVDVELTRTDRLGMTVWQPDAADARHQVALEVDQARFFAHYYSVFV